MIEDDVKGHLGQVGSLGLTHLLLEPHLLEGVSGVGLAFWHDAGQELDLISKGLSC
eukprot:CAMPEP_0173108122 /NCGR_PEP_ID=MMETSP1102-20130122/42446_1 /TAXON_ID=49646 /ORGANISM="Geminigera sp., Strain Caron Lab Isolate" /LENGTH=55 /DNA_ID=CAMNT_0014006365 /DNA_START=241 /DNA_END=408 /DNA_ORIENTATION=-